MKRARWLLIATVLLLALAAGFLLVIKWRTQDSFVDADQIVQENGLGALLEPGQSAGQTFVARHAGLAGIEFFLHPSNAAPLSLTLHLRTDPQSDADLVTTSLLLPAEIEPGFFRFSFPPLEASHGQYYYAFLEATQAGITLGLANGDAYLDGAAYEGHQPLDAQAAFRLVYRPELVIRDLLKAGLGWLGLLAIAGLLFVVPGWALLAWLLPAGRLSWAEMLGLAVGVSLALYPLLMLWTHLVGLNLGPLYAWLPVTLGVAALIWRYRKWRPNQAWTTLHRWAHSDALWPDLTLLFILTLVFGVRLLVVRTLEAAMWGDSYQHTMIAQLLVDNGGLFQSWVPYAELETFTYHFGFHSAVAMLIWLTKLPVVDATLWTGQLLNGLAVLSLYPLAVRVTGSRWGGVVAALVAGLLAPMPMYYVNWGRYTQLAGQVILPAAVWLTWEAVQRSERQWLLATFAGLVVGGLALTHYRVLIFYGMFALALMLVSLKPKHVWKETLLRLAWIGVVGGFVFLPWFVNAFGAAFLNLFWQQATTPPAQVHQATWEYNAIGRLETYLAPVWWLAMVMGLALGLWRRQRGVLLIALWWFLLLILANPAWLSLPGTGGVSNFTLFIAFYLPAGLFTSILVVQLLQAVDERKWVLALTTLVLMSIGLWGARERLADADPARHALLTRPDVRAVAWIQENTPSETRFLVNAFFAFGDSVLVGSDGGWWLPLLAGRRTTLPPVNYAAELSPHSDLRQEVEGLAREVQARSLDDPALVQSLRENGVTHVYVGQRHGRVNYAGPHVLDPVELQGSPYYRALYHQDRVWVFEIESQQE